MRKIIFRIRFQWKKKIELFRRNNIKRDFCQFIIYTPHMKTISTGNYTNVEVLINLIKTYQSKIIFFINTYTSSVAMPPLPIIRTLLALDNFF